MPLPNLLHDHAEICDESRISGDETLRKDEINSLLVGKWYQHLIGIALFIIYEVTVVKIMGVDTGVLDLLSTYLLDIGLFYLNGLYIIPGLAKLGRRMQLIWFILFLLFIIIVESSMQLGVNHLMRGYHTGAFTTTTSKEQLVRAIWRAIYVMGMGWAYWTAVYNHLKSKAENQQLLRQKEIERQNIYLENAYLQARIAPHFLFNTLNFIYYSALDNAKNTAPAIAELSDMMRYALATPGSDGKINLSDELQCVDRFITILKFRFGENLRLLYSVEIPDNKSTERIPPHILMTFVENMSKHGILNDDEIEALVTIYFEDDSLVMRTRNKKAFEKNQHSYGSGISNAIKRLEYHYPERYLMVRSDGLTKFEITLKIKL